MSLLITKEEVKRSIESLKTKKSPSLDGLTSEFYKEFTDFLSTDLVKIYNDIFASKRLLESHAHSILVLLAKKGNLRVLKNWHLLFLILAKILYYRMSVAAGDLIAVNQRCSVKGHTIDDCLLLVREVLAYSKTQGLGTYIQDQSKPFNRVHHMYL